MLCDFYICGAEGTSLSLCYISSILVPHPFPSQQLIIFFFFPLSCLALRQSPRFTLSVCPSRRQHQQHHCRNCGLIYCNECCKEKHYLYKFGYQDPVRVCSDCSARLGAFLVSLSFSLSVFSLNMYSVWAVYSLPSVFLSSACPGCLMVKQLLFQRQTHDRLYFGIQDPKSVCIWTQQQILSSVGNLFTERKEKEENNYSLSAIYSHTRGIHRTGCNDFCSLFSALKPSCRCPQ
jgi:hypothetical protein